MTPVIRAAEPHDATAGAVNHDRLSRLQVQTRQPVVGGDGGGTTENSN